MNSVLESVRAGIPLLCFPLFADQVTAIFLVVYYVAKVNKGRSLIITIKLIKFFETIFMTKKLIIFYNKKIII
jgi:hypothetical protein